MKTVISKENKNYKLSVKFWIDYNSLEWGAVKQIWHLSNLPFAFHHVAIMPDCHQGYGMPIGGVLATEGVIIPNAVGVDIGCGMCAIKTSLKVSQLNKEILKKIIGEIRKVIPVGFNHHKKEQDKELMPKVKLDIGAYEIGESTPHSKIYPIIHREYPSALKQLGTLGGGNHFIEIQKDTEDNIWIMIHSGSRNLGKKVADYYNKIAKELNKKWYSQVPKEWDLAFLPIETQEAKNYLEEMQYCVDFALANRQLMMQRIIEIFVKVLNEELYLKISEGKDCSFPNYQLILSNDIFKEKMINIAHNYARYENHFEKNVIVHRKGATSSREGEIGIIPGSQGSKSYIVKGKGNPESFNSCSHGAGRRMGRKQAQRTLNLEEEIKKLDEQGIIHGIRNVKDLDEATGSYKDIDVVMKNQEDLVEILVELTPLAVVKG